MSSQAIWNRLQELNSLKQEAWNEEWERQLDLHPELNEDEDDDDLHEMTNNAIDTEENHIWTIFDQEERKLETEFNRRKKAGKIKINVV